jgi:hypothetical protein
MSRVFPGVERGDPGAADWLLHRLHPFAQDVGSVIPEGFAAYARLFHPARDDHGEAVQWSRIAAWSGRVVHPEMQFHAIASPAPGRTLGPRPWDGETPQDGTPTVEQARILVDLIPEHAGSSGRCWFCLWEGYGFLHPQSIARAISRPARTPPPSEDTLGLPGPDAWEALRAWPRVDAPGRGYLIARGPLEAALTAPWVPWEHWYQAPNLWWPEDRSWCVASEIDFSWTYVGGSKEFVQAVLDHPALEALPARLSDGITADSDHLNE